ncbi:MAG: hypothetical protein WC583_04245 [Candidatus Omnitrophota bacterium]
MERRIDYDFGLSSRGYRWNEPHRRQALFLVFPGRGGYLQP